MDIVALEETCRAEGHADCGFVARAAEAWRASGDARALAALDALAFPILRELAAAHLPEPESQESASATSPARRSSTSGAR